MRSGDLGVSFSDKIRTWLAVLGQHSDTTLMSHQRGPVRYTVPLLVAKVRLAVATGAARVPPGCRFQKNPPQHDIAPKDPWRSLRPAYDGQPLSNHYFKSLYHPLSRSTEQFFGWQPLANQTYTQSWCLEAAAV